MLITCDMGNTTTKFAIYDGNKQISFVMIDTKPTDYKSFIMNFLYKANIRETQIDDSIIASVVPSLTGSLVAGLEEIIGKEPIVIDSNHHYGIEIDPTITDEIGADLLVMCAFAYQKLQTELIVVSLGTATVFSHVSKNGVFKHCVIAPGFETLAGAMYKNTAKLPEFEAQKKDTFLATNTIDAMSVGVFEGFIGMVRYLLAGLRGQLQTKPFIIGCGGAGKEISKYISEFASYDADLVTAGLHYIYNRYIK